MLPFDCSSTLATAQCQSFKAHSLVQMLATTMFVLTQGLPKDELAFEGMLTGHHGSDNNFCSCRGCQLC
jgi:hypothetical protein